MTTVFDWQAERDLALETVERNAGEVFKERAMAFALDWMAGKGVVSGEDITDACKAAGIVPHEDRAFGPVYLALARQGAIVRVGTLQGAEATVRLHLDGGWHDIRLKNPQQDR